MKRCILFGAMVFCHASAFADNAVDPTFNGIENSIRCDYPTEVICYPNGYCSPDYGSTFLPITPLNFNLKDRIIIDNIDNRYAMTNVSAMRFNERFYVTLDVQMLGPILLNVEISGVLGKSGFISSGIVRDNPPHGKNILIGTCKLGT